VLATWLNVLKNCRVLAKTSAERAGEAGASKEMIKFKKSPTDALPELA